MTALETLLAWLGAWQQGDYHAMATYTQRTWVKDNTARHLQVLLSGLEPMRYTVLREPEPLGTSEVFYTADIELLVGDKGRHRARVTLVCEEAPYTPRTVARGGAWGVNPVSVFLKATRKPAYSTAS